MIVEIEFAAGLAAIVTAEIETLIGKHGRILGRFRDDAIQVTYHGDLNDLLQLRTVIAVYTVLSFDIPRPKALLGHENFHQLIDHIQTHLDLAQYQTLYISAAGSDSSVMMRIKDDLATHLGLVVDEDEGDLLLRIRRTPRAQQGWDVLVRLTPRPLATRDWRINNYEGALNAAIAAAIIKISHPTPDDIFLNIACGSGTMLIERSQQGSAQVLSGCDIDPVVLSYTRDHIRAAEITSDTIKLVKADAIQLPYPTGYFSKVVADLPFGQLVGSHDENEWLYPAILHEAARVTQIKARFVIITHEIKLMESVLAQQSHWRLCEDPIRITQSGLHPRIYVLERV